MRHVIARTEDTPKFTDVPGGYTRVAVGGPAEGWLSYAEAAGAPAAFTPDGPTDPGDPLMLYFTSGTTARPKLVEHTHVSYPVGHLATMYWTGLRPGDVHLNISSPGWAKHAWSNLFAPWNAEATVFLHNYTRFDAERLLGEMERAGCHHLLRPADRLAHAHPGRPDPPRHPAPRGPGRRMSPSTPRSSNRSAGPGA